MKTLNQPTSSLSGWHVLFAMLGFFFAVTAVNGVMIYKALSTFGGDTVDAYRVGLDYNKRIAEEKLQDALGWTGTVAYDASQGRLIASLKDRSGGGIDNLDVKAEIGRPATDRADREVKLAGLGNGQYWAALPNLPEGIWAVDLTASEATGDRNVMYRSKVRLWKQP